MKTRGLVYVLVATLCMGAGWAWAGNETLQNTFYGYNAGYNSTGDNDADTFIGCQAGMYTVNGSEDYYGKADTFVGYRAGYQNTTGFNNTFIGYGAGRNNTTADSNTFVGYLAGYTNTTYCCNTFLGYQSGYSNTSGYYNIFIGWGAGYYNSSGAQNNFIGFRSGGSNTTGSGNTFLGYWTGYNNTTGSDNTFLGYNAGTSNTTGAGNVFLGYNAGYNETGSNKLYIDNSDTTTPLIYGEFDNNSVRINGAGIGVAGYPAYTLDVSNLGVTRSALHFSLDGTDTGGWIYVRSGQQLLALLGGDVGYYCWGMGTEVPGHPCRDGRVGSCGLPGDDEERVCGGHGLSSYDEAEDSITVVMWGLELSLPIRCIWQGGHTRMGPTGLIVQAGSTRTASGILRRRRH